jgi:hypothetical protein
MLRRPREKRYFQEETAIEEDTARRRAEVSGAALAFPPVTHTFVTLVFLTTILLDTYGLGSQEARDGRLGD